MGFRSDVFDFFNMPRLPMGDATMNSAHAGAGAGEENGQQYPAGLDGQNAGGHSNGSSGAMGNNEFNITNFMYDANADWFVHGNGR